MAFSSFRWRICFTFFFFFFYFSPSPPAGRVFRYISIIERTEISIFELRNSWPIWR